MKASPLLLKQYYVITLNVAANPNFKKDQPIDLSWEDFSVESEYAPSPHTAQWQVRLYVQHRAHPQRNYSYSFSLEMLGLMDVNPSFPEDKHKLLVEVNGASMLYGAAREIIRSATGHGPFLPILLPSVSFLPSKAVSAAG
jgi:preprotein translocase subunit SecB